MEKNNDKFTPDKVKKEHKVAFKTWWNNKALPTMSKLGNQRHLSAIRDSFGTMIPLIIAGGIGLLIDAIIFGGAGSGKVSLLGLFARAAGYSWDSIGALFADTTTSWGKASQIGALAFGQIQIATIGAMSLYFAFLLGYFLALSRNYKSPVIAGLASFAGFIIASMGQVSFFMDSKGLFTALIIGIATTELFVWFGNMKKLEIQLPAGVPPAVGKSFAVFLPMVFTLSIIGVFNILFLAPAIALPNIGFEVEQWNTLVSSGNLWNANMSGNVTLNNFANFLSSTYGVEIFQKINGGWDFTAKGAGWAMIFGQADITAVQAAFGNFGVGNQATMEAWFANFDPKNAGGLMSSTGWNSLGQFILAQGGNHGGIIGGNKGIEFLSANMFFSTNAAGEAFLTISERYVTVPIGANAFGFGAAIYRFFTSWFIGFATGNGGLGLAVIYVFFISFFWFFGVHGSNIMAAIFEPIWWMIIGVNTALISAGLSARTNLNDQVGIFGKPFFDIYMNIGGSGATLGLLIMVLILSRRRELKEVSKYALPAGCFNINEPVIFGFPLVLNPTYLAPFILSPMTAMLIGWVATGPLHLVNVVYVTVPWTTPWFLGAILATVDPMAILIALICFVVSTAIWIPFILLDNMTYYRKLKKTDPVAYEEEMKYLHDKTYRNQVKAEAKAEKNQAKIDLKKAREAKKAEHRSAKK
ncbi:PTS system, cellobiose-specific IIC component [Spiroplasma sp. NBRC 100390]|uniref:PTS sugar transporter subunit IIC n=1 Tax=unclassified Spiroplasma TaxID=2637901 RepID=UPI0008928BE8|nr:MULTISPECIES: PTS transporter subunit EIIC [unclassified Spiroplasma]AOX43415.1 PTS system, cellobiose-specific IIC component [Spiroplasma sp. TU-14]APE12885.1 PTS system, cellobiose-specific IIC component [Spiroplasma sp. NBRC 100390]